MRSFPPIGFVLPVIVAGVTSFSIWPELPQQSALILSEDEGVYLQVIAKSQNKPPLTDISVALQAFAERPLLAENRSIPQILPIEPIESQQTEAPVIDVQSASEPPSEPEPPEPPPPPPQLEVAGILSLGNESRALIRDTNTNQETWAVVGEIIDGWTLVEITQIAVTFTAQGTQFSIQLFK